jgi:hypothetical protein
MSVPFASFYFLPPSSSLLFLHFSVSLSSICPIERIPILTRKLCWDLGGPGLREKKDLRNERQKGASQGGPGGGRGGLVLVISGPRTF